MRAAPRNCYLATVAPRVIPRILYQPFFLVLWPTTFFCGFTAYRYEQNYNIVSLRIMAAIVMDLDRDNNMRTTVLAEPFQISYKQCL